MKEALERKPAVEQRKQEVETRKQSVGEEIVITWLSRDKHQLLLPFF